SEEAARAFADWRTNWKTEAREGDDSQSVSEALSKADRQLARVSDVFAELAAPGRGGDVSEDVISRAAAYVEFTLDCRRAIPEAGSLGLTRRDEVLDVLVERMRHWAETHGGRATARQLLTARVGNVKTVEEVGAGIARYEEVYSGCVTTETAGGYQRQVILAPKRVPRTRVLSASKYSAPSPPPKEEVASQKGADYSAPLGNNDATAAF